jgi:flagellar biosynthesis/type III secretory pathway protein FliH
VNLESLVTKEFLAARFAEQSSRIDSRFAEQDARIDTRFAEQDARIDTRFAEQDTRFDTRFAKLEAKVDSSQRINFWFQSIILAAVVIPYLERLMPL